MTVVPGLWSGSLVRNLDDGLTHIVRQNRGVRVALWCQDDKVFAQFKRLRKLPPGAPTCLQCVVAARIDW